MFISFRQHVSTTLVLRHRVFFPHTYDCKCTNRYGGFQLLHCKISSSAVSTVSDANNNSFVALLVISELRVTKTLGIYDAGCSTNSLLRTLYMRMEELNRRRSQICDVIPSDISQYLSKQLNLAFSYR
jgi:hypothetical protein